MKHIKSLFFLTVAFCAFNAMASVKPRKQVFTAAQPEGASLTIHHVGNGDVSFLQTIDGYLLTKDENGYYRYVTNVNPDGTLTASKEYACEPAERTSGDIALMRKYVRGNEHLSEMYSAMETKFRHPINRQIGLASTAPLASVGTPKIPIILVQFADLKFQVAETDDSVRTVFDKFCNGTNNGVNFTGAGSYGAVKDYFIAQSDSLFQPCFEVIGPDTLSNSYAYYGKDSGSLKDVNIQAFYQESIKMAQELQSDWTVFDNDSDGSIDMVYFIYAGEGQNGSDDNNTIWPKEQGSGGTIGGVKYGSYGCSNELYNGEIDGIGTICHELSHALGLPDLYDTNYVAFGMDYWDVMDAGNYCYNGKCPCGYSAYEKDFMGWTKLIVLDSENPQTNLTLLPLSEGGEGYKIINKNNPDEYYVLDNRQNTNWDMFVGYSTDKYGKAHGMLVTHVDYSKSSWTSNRVNNIKDHQRLTLIPADGELLIRNSNNTLAYLSSMQGDPYPGIQNVTSLEGERAVVYTGGAMNQPITNIQETNGGVVLFDYCIDDSLADAIEEMPVDVDGFVLEGCVLQANADVTVYNFAGLLVAQLCKDESVTLDGGVYIIRTRGTAQKIVVRK
jgi:M6 family metalloprotease-like protein